MANSENTYVSKSVEQVTNINWSNPLFICSYNVTEKGF